MPAKQLNLSAPDYLILIVEDLDRALGFYVDVLGLRLGHRSGDYAQLDTGTTRLALYTRSAMAKTLGMSLDRPCQMLLDSRSALKYRMWMQRLPS